MTERISAHPQTDAADIEIIHEGTALYTNMPEIEDLLDKVSWPQKETRLLDPGCGNGNMILAALRRLECKPEDNEISNRIRGYEFHRPSVMEARQRCVELLLSKGWKRKLAEEASAKIIQHKDFLLDEESEKADIILSNPPYWRRFRLPEGYRALFDRAVPEYARGDLLHAYLDKISRILKPEGIAALITSDRWIANATSAELRAQIGKRLKVVHAQRLLSESPFHRPKERKKSSPPRVHAISMILGEHGSERLGREPFLIDKLPNTEGIRFADLVDIRLAPWLGPDGIFLLERPDEVEGATVVPCIMPKGIDPETGAILEINRWAIVTGDREPGPKIMEHLKRTMSQMPKRGVRPVLWHPPERFDKHLPLKHEAILIPRIARKLRPIRIPAGHLPINHSLVIASGIDAGDIMKMLLHPEVQKQADILAPRVESGYRSYTATLLRQLVIPYEAVPEEQRKAA